MLPSARSLAAGFAILAVAAAAFAAARGTSLFALREIRVEGAHPALARQVREALEPVAGTSLVALDGDAVVSLVEGLPGVRSAGYDRAFPHTLVVTVRREIPAAVLRSGGESWLLSARGRVLKRLSRGAQPRLPRIWSPRTQAVSAGALVADADVRRALATLGPLRAEGLPVRVRTVRGARGALAYVLANGLELRLGDGADVRLKLAVARELLPMISPDVGYVDLSVPERPVVGPTLNSQVELEG